MNDEVDGAEFLAESTLALLLGDGSLIQDLIDLVDQFVYIGEVGLLGGRQILLDFLLLIGVGTPKLLLCHTVILCSGAKYCGTIIYQIQYFASISLIWNYSLYSLRLNELNYN